MASDTDPIWFFARASAKIGKLLRRVPGCINTLTTESRLPMAPAVERLDSVVVCAEAPLLSCQAETRSDSDEPSDAM